MADILKNVDAASIDIKAASADEASRHAASSINTRLIIVAAPPGVYACTGVAQAFGQQPLALVGALLHDGVAGPVLLARVPAPLARVGAGGTGLRALQARLDALGERAFTFFAVPPRVRGMGTFPVRAFALAAYS